MTELERALVALGAELEFPPEPNLVAGVRARLERRRRFAFVPRRRALVVAIALIVVAFGIAMAVPDARSAILRFFHIGSVTVERVETLPRAEQRPLTTGLGPALSRRAAERRARLQIKLPELEGPPPTRYYAQPGVIATLLHYRGRPVLLAELRGEQVGVAKKIVTPGTDVEGVSLGQFGLWLHGGRHVLRWEFRRPRAIETRLAGNVLIWLSGDLTFRLEGELDKSQMLELARHITL